MPTVHDGVIPKCCDSAMRALTIVVRKAGVYTTARAGWLCLICRKMVYGPSPTYVKYYGYRVRTGKNKQPEYRERF